MAESIAVKAGGTKEIVHRRREILRQGDRNLLAFHRFHGIIPRVKREALLVTRDWWHLAG
jgi:hypothetical protein